MPLFRHAVSAACCCTLFLTATLAQAADLWVARLQIDDGFALQTIQVVADSESACLDEVSSYRAVVAIAPCAPVTASTIIDDNTYGRGSGRRNPGTVQPDPGTSSGGSSSGGTASGAGSVLGGVGRVGGGG